MIAGLLDLDDSDDLLDGVEALIGLSEVGDKGIMGLNLHDSTVFKFSSE